MTGERSLAAVFIYQNGIGHAAEYTGGNREAFVQGGVDQKDGGLASVGTDVGLDSGNVPGIFPSEGKRGTEPFGDGAVQVELVYFIHIVPGVIGINDHFAAEFVFVFGDTAVAAEVSVAVADKGECFDGVGKRDQLSRR